MKPIPFGSLLVLLALAAGCATTGGAPVAGTRLKQADQKYPPLAREFSDDVQRGLVQEIVSHHQIGGQAAISGAMDQARAEWATEAQGLADFVDRFPASEWVVSFRFQAARAFLSAEQYAKAAAQADRLLRGSEADDGTRALAAKVAYVATRQLAQVKVQAGQLEGWRLLSWEQRKATPLNPRAPVGEWKGVVEYADQYVKLADRDPEAGKGSRDRLRAGSPAQIALQAAQIRYAFDDMEDARGRLSRLLDTWPSEADAGSVKLYLQTFLALKDLAGYDAALPRLKARLTDAQARATDARTRDQLAKALEQLDVDVALGLAARLGDAGQHAQAAAAFEAFAAANPSSPSAPLALFRAAGAHERAQHLDKAAALREQVMARYPDSKEAEAAMPMLAATRARQGRYDDAVKLYREFIEKYPDSPLRCSSVFNLGQAYDQQRKGTDAATSYLAYGIDARCAKESPNGAANVLFRAGELFDKSGRRAEAKQAYQACADLPGVTNSAWLASQQEARKRAKR